LRGSAELTSPVRGIRRDSAPADRPAISVIVPALDEVATLPRALAPLQSARGRDAEIIVVDGGSRDGTPRAAHALSDRVLSAPRGRALQMNLGAELAGGRVLLFLHADTFLPSGWAAMVRDALEARGREWGRFDVRLDGAHPMLRVVERAMNLRSRLSGIATGDQAMFATRAVFEAVGGFPRIALMEDIALSRALRSRSRPACLRAAAVTSSRRWERNGIARTIALMWRLRLRYALGADPDGLARLYRGVPAARIRRPDR